MRNFRVTGKVHGVGPSVTLTIHAQDEHEARRIATDANLVVESMEDWVAVKERRQTGEGSPQGSALQSTLGCLAGMSLLVGFGAMVWGIIRAFPALIAGDLTEAIYRMGSAGYLAVGGALAFFVLRSVFNRLRRPNR